MTGLESGNPSGARKLKITYLPGAALMCLCSKLLCATALFLTEEGEFALSTIAFLLSGIAVVLAARLLDTAMGLPVARTLSRLASHIQCGHSGTEAR